MSTSAKQKRHKREVNMADYSNFVEQVQLVDIRLASINAQVKNLPERDTIHTTVCTVESTYETREGGFAATIIYRVRIVNPETKKQVARISETFVVDYRSKIPVTDEIFTAFANFNLPLNTWPYFRELTHNTTVRMNMPRLIAPTLPLPMARSK